MAQIGADGAHPVMTIYLDESRRGIISGFFKLTINLRLHA
jgi:hypothetical protein